MLSFISNEPNGNEYQREATEICDEYILKEKRTLNKRLTNHNIQRERHKIPFDYMHKSFDDFELMIVELTL